MRIRTVKPEFWTNEPLSNVSEAAALLALALLNYADDEGYFNANPKLILAACFPLRELSMSIHGAINELCVIDYIRLYEGSDNRRYGQVTAFKTHQRINRPTPSKIKQLLNTLPLPVEPINKKNSTIHGGFNEDSMRTHTRKGKEQGREQGKEGNREPSAKIAPGKGMPFLIEILPVQYRTPEVLKALNEYDVMRRKRRYPVWVDTTCKAKVEAWVKLGLTPDMLVFFLNNATINEYQGIPTDKWRYERHLRDTAPAPAKAAAVDISEAIREAQLALATRGQQ